MIFYYILKINKWRNLNIETFILNLIKTKMFLRDKWAGILIKFKNMNA